MMPKVIGNDSLIARVNEVQGCMYRQSNELGRLNRSVKKCKDENEKLRQLVYDMLEDEERGHNDESTFYEHVIRACKLEVDGAETFI